MLMYTINYLIAIFQKYNYLNNKFQDKNQIMQQLKINLIYLL